MPVPVDDITATLAEVVFYARTGGYADAASRLNAGLQKLQQALGSGMASDAQVRKLAYSLETLLLMQQQQDWVAAADVIEYELVVLLKEAFSPLSRPAQE